ncbi:hypothetical protein [Marinospirillum sp.]|uniref:hypothetical protein n=1 Tax=Marinospirillum sp. TaxID=2183934 RepID=UPI002870747B|nr:hypothetical protein [Marinospirillum sp.]MDR9467975.1 hypothetical protein [Marinospirillum sp.]
MLLKLGLLLLTLPLILLMGAWGVEYVDVSNCIHEGGHYDYLNSQCVEDAGAPFIPFAQRHPLLVSSCMWAACAGLLLCLVALYRSRR